MSMIRKHNMLAIASSFSDSFNDEQQLTIVNHKFHANMLFYQQNR